MKKGVTVALVVGAIVSLIIGVASVIIAIIDGEEGNYIDRDCYDY